MKVIKSSTTNPQHTSRELPKDFCKTCSWTGHVRAGMAGETVSFDSQE